MPLPLHLSLCPVEQQQGVRSSVLSTAHLSFFGQLRGVWTQHRASVSYSCGFSRLLMCVCSTVKIIFLYIFPSKRVFSAVPPAAYTHTTANRTRPKGDRHQHVGFSSAVEHDALGEHRPVRYRRRRRRRRQDRGRR